MSQRPSLYIVDHKPLVFKHQAKRRRRQLVPLLAFVALAVGGGLWVVFG